MNINLDEALSSIDAAAPTADDEGNSIPLVELIRIPVEYGHKPFTKAYKASPAYLDLRRYWIMLVMLFERIRSDNAGEENDRKIAESFCTHNLDVVLYKNGALMVLPHEGLAETEVEAFNPGWGTPTVTNFKSVMAATNYIAACHLFSALVQELKDNDALTQAQDFLYAMRDAALSTEFDGCKFYQLID